ncbi:helix-turn-helix domain-containing protein [Frigidibacter sp. SD6-1]|uniref:helix-turn-helix domain-containing protein n=1 Tax=Frigidibacter sp. SD6-1 TaxID=3032581 RepID=UPI0024DF6506|nr:helix-turn-helix domain-containing protein [Frigidibacter sp. SD6-1]
MPHALHQDIRRLPLFSGIGEETFRDLMRAAYDQQMPPHVTVVSEGAPADFLHVVVEGMVELFASTNGRDATMAVVRPVSTFILAACVRDAPYLMSARTLQRSRLLLVPSVNVRAAVAADSRFALNAMQDLAGCYRGLVRHTKNLKLRNTRERIAAYLLRQSRLIGDAPGFTLPVEKRLIASYMGMTPENLSRAFKSLAADGCKIDGQRVIITDRARLEALAGLSLLLDGPDPDASAAGVSLPLPEAS